MIGLVAILGIIFLNLQGLCSGEFCKMETVDAFTSLTQMVNEMNLTPVSQSSCQCQLHVKSQLAPQKARVDMLVYMFSCQKNSSWELYVDGATRVTSIGNKTPKRIMCKSHKSQNTEEYLSVPVRRLFLLNTDWTSEKKNNDQDYILRFKIIRRSDSNTWFQDLHWVCNTFSQVTPPYNYAVFAYIVVIVLLVSVLLVVLGTVGQYLWGKRERFIKVKEAEDESNCEPLYENTKQVITNDEDENTSQNCFKKKWQRKKNKDDLQTKEKENVNDDDDENIYQVTPKLKAKNSNLSVSSPNDEITIPERFPQLKPSPIVMDFEKLNYEDVSKKVNMKGNKINDEEVIVQHTEENDLYCNLPAKPGREIKVESYLSPEETYEPLEQVIMKSGMHSYDVCKKEPLTKTASFKFFSTQSWRRQLKKNKPVDEFPDMPLPSEPLSQNFVTLNNKDNDGGFTENIPLPTKQVQPQKNLPSALIKTLKRSLQTNKPRKSSVTCDSVREFKWSTESYNSPENTLEDEVLTRPPATLPNVVPKKETENLIGKEDTQQKPTKKATPVKYNKPQVLPKPSITGTLRKEPKAFDTNNSDYEVFENVKQNVEETKPLQKRIETEYKDQENTPYCYSRCKDIMPDEDVNDNIFCDDMYENTAKRNKRKPALKPKPVTGLQQEKIDKYYSSVPMENESDDPYYATNVPSMASLKRKIKTKSKEGKLDRRQRQY